MHRWALILLAGCRSTPEPVVEPPATTSTLAPFELATSTDAWSASGTVAADTAHAPRAGSLALSALALSVGVPGIAAVLEEHGGATLVGPATVRCWTSKADATADLDACEAFDMAGSIQLLSDPAGPLDYQFLNYRVKDRVLSGALSYTRAKAPLEWTLGSSTPMAIVLDEASGEVSLDGTVGIDPSSGVLTFAGSAEGTGGSVRFGTDGPVELPTDWTACRCPTAGRVAWDTDIQLTAAEIDLDLLGAGSNGLQDPALEVPIDLVVPATVDVTYDRCAGEALGVDVEGPVTALVPAEDIRVSVAAWCGLGLEDYRGQCDWLQTSLEGATKAVRVSIDPEDVEALAATALDGATRDHWCQVY